MAFGLGKKSETRSSRPLSMMLPDNVKLFSKKTRNVLDRTLENNSATTERRRSRNSSSIDPSSSSTASHRNSAGSRHSMSFFSPTGYRSMSQSSHSSTSVNTTSSPAPAPQLAPNSAIPPRKSSAAYMQTLRSADSPNPSVYNSSSHSPAASTISVATSHQARDSREALVKLREVSPVSQTISPAPPAVSAIPQAQLHSAKKLEESMPFLTLQLEDTHDESLMNLSKHYSMLPVSAEDSFDLSSSPAETLNNAYYGRDMGLALKLDSDLTPQGTPVIPPEPERVIPSEPSSAATEEFLFSDSGYANVSALSLGSRPATSDNLDDKTPTVGSDFDTNWTVKARDTPVLYQLDQRFIAPDSDDSHAEDASTAPSSMRSIDELLVSPNRKVVLNRAIYIFDPAANGEDLSKMTLSEDDLFNPFEY